MPNFHENDYYSNMVDSLTGISVVLSAALGLLYREESSQVIDLKTEPAGPRTAAFDQLPQRVRTPFSGRTFGDHHARPRGGNKAR